MSEFRYRLILGKYPITKVEPVAGGIRIKVRVSEGVSFDTIVPTSADVRLGDLLTLYTEVLTKEPNYGEVKPAPIQ